MREIERISIIGMGALGILYGDFFGRALGWDKVAFLVDGERFERYQGRQVSCNGRPCPFRVLNGDAPVSQAEKTAPAGALTEGSSAALSGDSEGKPADLLIFAVKATALDDAVALAAKGHVGEDTIILSVLNGISSEEIIGRSLGREHVLTCVAQGMDATKMGNDLEYSHIGQICLGIRPEEREKAPMLEAVTALFDRIGLPYTREKDVLARLWGKWMLNVGVNQTVMVTEGTYGTVQKPGPARDMMTAAMGEVLALAKREGISVTEKDLADYVALIDSLDPEGMPSMRQDGLLKRPSEVELFAGTVVRRARAAGIPVPVNEELYRRIQEMEAAYKE